MLVGVTAVGSAVGSDYRNNFSLPGTESQRAADLLGGQAAEPVQIVLQAGGGLTAARERVDAMLSDVADLPHVAGVVGPYDGRAISRDGTIGYATVALDAPATDVPKEDVRRIIATAQAADGDGLRVEVGGEPVREAEESEGGAAEGVGMLAALVVLVVLFGSLVAASLPLVTAIFAVGTTLGLIVLASHVADFADFTPPPMPAATRRRRPPARL